MKIVPFSHPLTLLDLEEVKREREARPDEDRGMVLVCLGKEPAADAWIEDWNRLRRGKEAANRIEVIELRTDPKDGKFFQHQPATARVKVARKQDRIIGRGGGFHVTDHRRAAARPGSTTGARW